MIPYENIEALHADLRQCRRCAEAGFRIESQPVFSGPAPARLMLIGQAPGRTERERRRPFAGDAGRRLFRWLATAGWEEAAFRTTCYMTSVTKCFPGGSANGSGDRVPTAAERALCRTWLDEELRLVQPEVIVPVGRLAMGLFYPSAARLEDLIGTLSADGNGRRIVPLPHPSGASRWFNNADNQGRLECALGLLRALKNELKL